MLHSFLEANRDALIDRCRSIAALRLPPPSTDPVFHDGIPLFLDQLIVTLQAEERFETSAERSAAGPRDARSGSLDIGVSAARHGRVLSDHGFTVEQVVHDYGDLCQAITGLASEIRAPIQAEEFQILNRCLDDGIAEAVTEFSYQRKLARDDQEAETLNERLGSLAHELRNHLSTATLAFSLIKSGRVAVSGATGAVMDRSLMGLRSLIDRSLVDVRLNAGIAARHELVSVSDLIADVKASASLDAQFKGCEFSVSAVDSQLAVDADRDLLSAAIGNLLQNAFKFTHHRTRVLLSAYAQDDRILIDIQDQCGGLPPGKQEEMFLPFIQNGADRSGVGLGLSIVRRSVEAINGVLSVRNLPGSGCVFTINLPRRALP